MRIYNCNKKKEKKKEEKKKSVKKKTGAILTYKNKTYKV